MGAAVLASASVSCSPVIGVLVNGGSAPACAFDDTEGSYRDQVLACATSAARGDAFAIYRTAVGVVQGPRASNEVRVEIHGDRAQSQQLAREGSSRGLVSSGRSEGFSTRGLERSGSARGLERSGSAHGLARSGSAHGLARSGSARGLSSQGRSAGLAHHGSSQGSVRVEKSASRRQVELGERVSFALTVHNDLAQPIHDVVVIDRVPLELRGANLPGAIFREHEDGGLLVIWFLDRPVPPRGRAQVSGDYVVEAR